MFIIFVVVTGASEGMVDLLPETRPGVDDDVFEFDGETRAVEVGGVSVRLSVRRLYCCIILAPLARSYFSCKLLATHSE